jgi:uncharacterized protein (DUF1330 family)
MPKAYVICDIEVTDPAAYEEYKRLSGPSLERHGGRFLVRGGDVEVLEGDRVPQRIVVVEFDDAGAARAWYDSEDYRAARRARAGAANASFVLVQGV